MATPVGKYVTCEFCGHRNEDCCRAKIGAAGYLCTRLAGHSGPHIACAGTRNHQIATSEQKPKK